MELIQLMGKPWLTESSNPKFLYRTVITSKPNEYRQATKIEINNLKQQVNGEHSVNSDNIGNSVVSDNIFKT